MSDVRVIRLALKPSFLCSVLFIYFFLSPYYFMYSFFSFILRHICLFIKKTKKKQKKQKKKKNRNAVKIKKRRIVADYVASVSESGNRDRCLGDSVASLGVNTGL